MRRPVRNWLGALVVLLACTSGSASVFQGVNIDELSEDRSSLSSEYIDVLDNSEKQYESLLGNQEIVNRLRHFWEIASLVQMLSGGDIAQAWFRYRPAKFGFVAVGIRYQLSLGGLSVSMCRGLAGVLGLVSNVWLRTDPQIKDSRAHCMDIGSHLPLSHFSRDFYCIISGLYRVPCSFERGPEQDYGPYTGPGGCCSEYGHKPLSIPVAEEYVIVRADGIAFLYLLVIGACISIATTCVLCLVAPPESEDRNKSDAGHKKQQNAKRMPVTLVRSEHLNPPNSSQRLYEQPDKSRDQAGSQS